MDSGRERRIDTRVPVDLAAHLELKGAQVPVRAVDLSVGGALLECRNLDWPEPGEAVLVSLALDGRRLDLLARIVRRSGEIRAAVAFESMDGACESALARFVRARDRQRLRTHLHLLG